MAVAVRFRSGLALQVDLRRVVDRDQTVVLHDDVRRVGVVDLVAVEVSIAIDRCIQTTRTERKGVDDLSGVQRLSGACDAARLIKFRDAIGQHFSVNAKIADAAFKQ